MISRQALWEAGYRPVPVKTGAKAPSGETWTATARLDPPPCALPGAVATPWARSTGILTDGLRALDIDIDDADTVADVERIAREVLGDAPARIRHGSPRCLLLYASADGEPRKRVLKGTAGKIEALGLGQQFVADGRHPDGGDYGWRDGDPLSVPRSQLVAISEEQLDGFFQRVRGIIGAEIAPATPVPKPQPRHAPASTAPSQGLAREHAYATEALDKNTAELTAAGSGERNNRLNGIAFRMGRLVGAGWIEKAVVEAALVGACEENGLTRDDGLPSVLKTLASGLNGGLAYPHEPLELTDDADDFRIELAEDGTLIDSETGEIVEAADEAAVAEFADEDLMVPGLVGDIAQWILDTNPKPIRLFATAAALTVVSTLIGRRCYAGSPLSGAHLYIMIVMGTGGGKDRPQAAVKQLLDAVGERLHRTSVSSASSLALKLQAQPLQVQIIDEVMQVFRKASNRSASSQEQALIEAYCTLWGTSTGDYMPEAVTSRGDIVIKRPHIGIIGGTTPVEFASQMKNRQIANGILNRFMVLVRRTRVPFRKPSLPSHEVPERLIERCQRLFNFQADQMVQTATSVAPLATDPDRPPAMEIVPLTPEAEVLLDREIARQEDYLVLSDRDSTLEIYARYAEQIKRVALVVAAGRYADRPGLAGVQIDAEDIRWATRLVRWSLDSFVEFARQNMVENQAQADFKWVLGLIRSARRMTRSELVRSVGGRLKSRDLDEIVRTMTDAGNIVMARGEAPKRGPAPKIYAYVRG